MAFPKHFKVKIYVDSADAALIDKYAPESYVSGFTTNPTLMKTAGVQDYAAFAKTLISKIPDRPISFEVFSDELPEMQRQAFEIAHWGKNAYVKIPVTNSRGETTTPVIKALSAEGVRLNVTALLTFEQLVGVHKALNPEVPSVLSVFAGRIADTGRDAVAIMRQCREYLGHGGKAELLWASSRELYNLVQAEEAGADIITMSPDLLKKLPMYGMDLTALSLDTVKMFKRDAESAGFQL